MANKKRTPTNIKLNLSSLPARVTPMAHELTPILCEFYAKEKGLTSVSRTDAISLAVQEAVERRQLEAVKS